MARGSFLWDAEAQKWAPKHEVLAKRLMRTPNRASSLASPLVIGTMAPIKSMIDGRMYDSKSEYYRHVERNNCAIVGFDKNWTDHVEAARRQDDSKREADIVADVKKSIEQLNSGTAEPINHA